MGDIIFQHYFKIISKRQNKIQRKFFLPFLINGMSTYQEVFYTFRLGINVHYTFFLLDYLGSSICHKVKPTKLRVGDITLKTNEIRQIKESESQTLESNKMKIGFYCYKMRIERNFTKYATDENTPQGDYIYIYIYIYIYQPHCTSRMWNKDNFKWFKFRVFLLLDDLLY